MKSFIIIVGFCLINFTRTETIIRNTNSTNGDLKNLNNFSFNKNNHSITTFSHNCQHDLNETARGYKLLRPWAIASELY